MKNLDYALKVLAKVGMPIEFTIYGPLEDKPYWQLCQELIAKLPTHIKVKYAGSLEPTVVSETLSRYDLFFLPTRGENFGHVIAESLAAGCPVLISDQTPWRDLETNGCGWALSLDEPLNFSNVIDKMATISPEERSIWSKNAISYMDANEINSDNMKKNLQLFIGLSKLVNKFCCQ